MVNTFFIGDTHFSHNNILNFKKDDGGLLRPFDSIEDHDEYIIDVWNKTVRPIDIVYHLGDVVMNERALPICSRLHGVKILIGGNHDKAKTSQFTKYFTDIYGCKEVGSMILTHIPIHTSCIERWKANIHGHLHSNIIDDNRYFNVSCEQVDYTPISLEQVKKVLLERGVQ